MEPVLEEERRVVLRRAQPPSCSDHTFARSFPLYTGISRQPLSAPSASPPRSSCLTWPASERTSASPISGRGGCRVEVSKLTDESSCSASMLMVRQASLSDADVCCCMMDMVSRGQRWPRSRTSRGRWVWRLLVRWDHCGLACCRSQLFVVLVCRGQTSRCRCCRAVVAWNSDASLVAIREYATRSYYTAGAMWRKAVTDHMQLSQCGAASPPLPLLRSTRQSTSAVVVYQVLTQLSSEADSPTWPI
jgi:hypothetical protein